MGTMARYQRPRSLLGEVRGPEPVSCVRGVADHAGLLGLSVGAQIVVGWTNGQMNRERTKGHTKEVWGTNGHMKGG